MSALESGNRRAERDGNFVVFLLMSGVVRRSKRVVWTVRTESDRKAKRLAEDWVLRNKLTVQ